MSLKDINSKNGSLGIISPHFDDAVFSVGGFLSKTEGVKKVVTICGGTPSNSANLSSWDSRCGFTSAKQASIERKTEDYMACQELNVSSACLSFADFPYAGKKCLSQVREELEMHLEGIQELWAPLSIGKHPDHIVSRDVAIQIATKFNIPIYLYADAPYASARGWHTPDHKRDKPFQWGPSLREVSEQGFVLANPKVQFLSESEMSKKLAAVSCYKSQLAPLKKHYPNIMERTGELSAEALWKITVKETCA